MQRVKGRGSGSEDLRRDQPRFKPQYEHRIWIDLKLNRKEFSC